MRSIVMDIEHRRHHHFLLLSCPAQGHINPTLELAKRLVGIGGTRVTYATTIHGLSQIKSFPSFQGLSYASFSDGFDDGVKPINDPHLIMSEFERVGSQTLAALIEKISKHEENPHSPVTFVIYSVLLPWAAQVASDLGIPSAFLCIQSTTSFALCHRYFNYFHNRPPFPSSITIEALPPFAPSELPSYLLPTSPHVSFLPTFQQHIQASEQDKPHSNLVLLNTFDALEEAAIDVIRSNMNVIPIGPLVPNGLWAEHENQSSDGGFRCDLFDKSEADYLHWLDSKPDCSVVYVSFGTMVVLKRDQTEEILNGLVGSGLQVLWVIRHSENGGDQEADQGTMIKNRLKAKERGLVVPWCSQAEVLRHKSVGCFVMHCGWNSTVESLVAGVPMVGCPQFSDQNTNAKLVEEVWGIGVRAKVNEEGVTEGQEIKRCLRIVMGDGERGEEIRRNCQKWKGLAVEAVKEGGSSDCNLRHFIGGLG